VRKTGRREVEREGGREGGLGVMDEQDQQWDGLCCGCEGTQRSGRDIEVIQA